MLAGDGVDEGKNEGDNRSSVPRAAGQGASTWRREEGLPMTLEDLAKEANYRFHELNKVHSFGETLQF